MSSARIVEIGEIAAGIVVLEQGGFRFFAAERRFHSLEGALFRTIDHAARASRELLRHERWLAPLRPHDGEVRPYTVRSIE